MELARKLSEKLSTREGEMVGFTGARVPRWCPFLDFTATTRPRSWLALESSASLVMEDRNNRCNAVARFVLRPAGGIGNSLSPVK